MLFQAIPRKLITILLTWENLTDRYRLIFPLTLALIIGNKMATHGENIKADVVQIETSDHVDATQAEQNIKARHHVNTQMDDAAALLEAAGGQFEITPEDRKRILRKVDLWVCLPMCIVSSGDHWLPGLSVLNHGRIRCT